MLGGCLKPLFEAVLLAIKCRCDGHESMKLLTIVSLALHGHLSCDGLHVTPRLGDSNA